MYFSFRIISRTCRSIVNRMVCCLCVSNLLVVVPQAHTELTTESYVEVVLSGGSHPLNHQRNLSVDSALLLLKFAININQSLVAHINSVQSEVFLGFGIVESSLNAEAQAPVLAEVVGPVESDTAAEAHLAVNAVNVGVLWNVHLVVKGRQSTEAADRKFMFRYIVLGLSTNRNSHSNSRQHCCATLEIHEMFHTSMILDLLYE